MARDSHIYKAESGHQCERFSCDLYTHTPQPSVNTHMPYILAQSKSKPRIVILYPCEGQLFLLISHDLIPPLRLSLGMHCCLLSVCCLLPHNKALDEWSHLRVWNNAFCYLTNVDKQERKRQNPSQVVSGEMKPCVVMDLHFWALTPPSWETRGARIRLA